MAPTRMDRPMAPLATDVALEAMFIVFRLSWWMAVTSGKGNVNRGLNRTRGLHMWGLAPPESARPAIPACQSPLVKAHVVRVVPLDAGAQRRVYRIGSVATLGVHPGPLGGGDARQEAPGEGGQVAFVPFGDPDEVETRRWKPPQVLRIEVAQLRRQAEPFQ